MLSVYKFLQKHWAYRTTNELKIMELDEAREFTSKRFTAKEFNYFCDEIRHNASLVSLTLKETTDLELAHLAPCLSLHPRLESLGITRFAYDQDQRLTQAGISMLVEILANNPNINTLSINTSNVDIDPNALDCLFEYLAQNRTLKKLILNVCMDDACLAKLAVSLRTNRSLAVLDFGMNHVTNEGCRALLTSLQYNKALSVVELHSEYFTIDLLPEIYDKLRCHPALTRFKLRSFAWNEDDPRAITYDIQKDIDRFLASDVRELDLETNMQLALR